MTQILSGRLTVGRKGDMFEMDFPSRMPEEIEVNASMIEALGTKPAGAYLSRDLMLVLDNEAMVRDFMLTLMDIDMVAYIQRTK